MRGHEYPFGLARLARLCIETQRSDDLIDLYERRFATS
jgi:hypothetical protein